jgi:hypothetical protein
MSAIWSPTKADRELGRAVRNLDAVGVRTPCVSSPDDGAWLSENPRQRAKAAGRCHGCPVFADCDAAASAGRVVFGVWAGRDRTIRRRKKKDKKPGNQRKFTTEGTER